MDKSKNIGIKVNSPEKTCDDRHCPFHGGLKARGRIFVARVKAAKSPKSATVEWGRKTFIKKYERYEKRRTIVRVHNPACIDAKEGDMVKIVECRPISKTKKFVIIGRVEKNASA